ncbi:unnamed protein product [Mesocestoides corti]|nr:unnamed protein product [Mesocestoides corti]
MEIISAISGLIAKAILSSKERRMVLSEIYEWIQFNYSYFRSRGPGWRNSIRHNLSLNDCFIKVGRSSNGKGHYWGIHPANVEDFCRGDFRRRRAQRKVRRALGLSCPGDADDSDSPPLSPPPPHSTFGFLPFRSIDSAGRSQPHQFVHPPPPPPPPHPSIPMDVFTTLLNGFATAGLLPLPPQPPFSLPPLEPHKPPLPHIKPPPSESFSVANLLGMNEEGHEGALPNSRCA